MITRFYNPVFKRNFSNKHFNKKNISRMDLALESRKTEKQNEKIEILVYNTKRLSTYRCKTMFTIIMYLFKLKQRKQINKKFSIDITLCALNLP